MRTEADNAVIKKLEAAGAKCTGAPWFYDAAIFAQTGTPAVAIGPGSIAQAHTCDEFITLSDLEEEHPIFPNLFEKPDMSAKTAITPTQQRRFSRVVPAGHQGRRPGGELRRCAAAW